jgi:arylsulfatase
MPLAGGFDRSYSLNDHDRHFGPRNHTEDDKPLPAVDAAKEKYYSSTAIAEHAIKSLKEHGERFPGRPFFEFLAFTSPHFPVQAPAEDIAKYRGKYLAGWDEMRRRRWEMMQGLKIAGVSLSAIEREVGPPSAHPEAIKKLGAGEVNRPVPWESLTAEQREFQACKMAVHAAMVDRMDREIGRVMAQVKAMGALENTIVMFLSDNGASAEIMVRGDGHDQHAECGTGATFLSIGPGWSSLANTPFRRHKSWVHEGGIATPLIVHWPAGIKGRGEMRHTPGHVIDLVPTILELAGGKAPTEWKGMKAPARAGKSLAAVFGGDVKIERESMWWMHQQNRALRAGDWKIVAAGRDGEWELYDLSVDRSETKNLAKERPEKVKELAGMWEKKLAEVTALAKADLAVEDAPKGAGNSRAEGQRPAVAMLSAVARTDRNSQIAHQQMVEKAKKGRIDLYFVGDSITRRWGASDSQYKELLANWREKFHGWNAGNFGWGADRLENILWRMENGELDGVNPKVIVLMGGTNNVSRPRGNGVAEAVEEVVGGIETIVEVMRKKAPEAVIVVMGITPRTDAGGGARANEIIEKVNARLANLGKWNGVRFLNINEKLVGEDGKLREGMTVDGLHLSVKGYQVWAEGLRPILREVLGERGKEDLAPEATGDPSAQKRPG